jgi:hypothetical protein
MEMLVYFFVVVAISSWTTIEIIHWINKRI